MSEQCPRCKGHGATIQDANKGDGCTLCDGDGRLVVVDKSKGIYRKRYSSDKLYW